MITIRGLHNTFLQSPVSLRMWFRRMSPLATCIIAKSLTILSEIVPFPQPGGPMMRAFNSLHPEAISVPSRKREVVTMRCGRHPVSRRPCAQYACRSRYVVVPAGIQRVL